MASSQPHDYADHLMDHILLPKSARDEMAAPKANGHTPQKKKKAAGMVAKPGMWLFCYSFSHSDNNLCNSSWNQGQEHHIQPSNIPCIRVHERTEETNRNKHLYEAWSGRTVRDMEGPTSGMHQQDTCPEHDQLCQLWNNLYGASCFNRSYGHIMWQGICGHVGAYRRTQDLVCYVFVQKHQQMPSSKVCGHLHDIFLLLTIYILQKHEKENIPEEDEDENIEDECKVKKQPKSKVCDSSYFCWCSVSLLLPRPQRMRILAPPTFLTTTISSPSVSGGCVMLNPAALASIASSIPSTPHTSLSCIATLTYGVQPWSVLTQAVEVTHILTN